MPRSTLNAQASALNETHRQLDIALGAMTQGLCLYDEANRLQLWNPRFAQLYQINHGLNKGMRFDQVIGLTVSLGLYGERPIDEVLEARHAFIARREHARMDQTLKSGTVIEIVHVPLEDGGWVATYEDVTARRKAEERLLYLATHDEMTGLANRSKFMATATAFHAAYDRAHDFVIMLLDLDGFKRVNDTFGHPAGDALLIEVGRRLEGLDTRAEVIARLGGDEFALLRRCMPNDSSLRPWAQAIVDALCTPYTIGGEVVKVGASAGVAIARAHWQELSSLLAQADLALYVAKHNGGARVMIS
jgi:diguanylate cyclase (GGDEF)-like protein